MRGLLLASRQCSVYKILCAVCKASYPVMSCSGFKGRFGPAMAQYAHLLAVVAASLPVYSNMLNAPFVFDDSVYMVNNLKLRDYANFSDLSNTRFPSFF